MIGKYGSVRDYVRTHPEGRVRIERNFGGYAVVRDDNGGLLEHFADRWTAERAVRDAFNTAPVSRNVNNGQN